jgi:hypothetical protein
MAEYDDDELEDQQQPEDFGAEIAVSAQYAEGELPTISRAEYERAWRESEAPHSGSNCVP